MILTVAQMSERPSELGEQAASERQDSEVSESESEASSACENDDAGRGNVVTSPSISSCTPGRQKTFSGFTKHRRPAMHRACASAPHLQQPTGCMGDAAAPQRAEKHPSRCTVQTVCGKLHQPVA